jgi:uncharacterized membrane protein required for colicin V production
LTLDEICLLALVIAAVAGAFFGALSQLAQLGAVLIGSAGARLIAPRLAPLLAPRLPRFAASPAATLIAFVGCAGVAGLFARAVVRGLAEREQRGGVDRALGALLGGTQAALVIFTALGALSSFGRPVKLGPLVFDPRGSELVAFAKRQAALFQPPSRRGETSRLPP